jgi:ribosomal protein L37AE/L43A
MFGKSVEARNALQNCGRVHPYTCENNDCRNTTNQDPLRAVEDGWICDHCGYTQSNTANVKEHATPLAGVSVETGGEG